MPISDRSNNVINVPERIWAPKDISPETITVKVLGQEDIEFDTICIVWKVVVVQETENNHGATPCVIFNLQ